MATARNIAASADVRGHSGVAVVLPGRGRIAAAKPGADLGWVFGEILADDVQAELTQDRGGGLAFKEELERCPDKLLRGDVTAAEGGRKVGGHAHLVACCRTAALCLDAESAVGLPGDREPRHAVTLALRRAAQWRRNLSRPRRAHRLRNLGQDTSGDGRRPGAWLPTSAGRSAS